MAAPMQTKAAEAMRSVFLIGLLRPDLQKQAVVAAQFAHGVADHYITSGQKKHAAVSAASNMIASSQALLKQLHEAEDAARQSENVGFQPEPNRVLEKHYHARNQDLLERIQAETKRLHQSFQTIGHVSEALFKNEDWLGMFQTAQHNVQLLHDVILEEVRGRQLSFDGRRLFEDFRQHPYVRFEGFDQTAPLHGRRRQLQLAVRQLMRTVATGSDENIADIRLELHKRNAVFRLEGYAQGIQPLPRFAQHAFMRHGGRIEMSRGPKILKYEIHLPLREG